MAIIDITANRKTNSKLARVGGGPVSIPAFRASSLNAAWTGYQALSTAPATRQVGDLLILFVNVGNNTQQPAGYTMLDTSRNVNGEKFHIGWRIATNTSADAPSWGLTNYTTKYAVIIAYSGTNDPVAPIDSFVTPNVVLASNTRNAVSISSVANNCLAVSIEVGYLTFNSPTVTAPAVVDVAGGYYVEVSKQLATAGSGGGHTVTSTSVGDSISYGLSIK